MARPKLSMLLGLIVSFAFAGLLFAQRADRGIITGVVIDPAGAAVPAAAVTIIDEGTKVATALSTTETGNYGSPPLILGKYTVRIEKAGFKTFVRTGIELAGGITYRQDATLELGAMTTTVEVKAASEMINVSSAEVVHSLGEKYYTDLPVVMGADIRMAESLLHAQPGYVPMAPNGDAMFRGSQFNSRINGGQTMATENWMDGAAFGYARGHQQTQESSPPYESIREMKVINSSFSAQYGHTSGAFIEYVSKSGSNKWHGSVFDYLGNSALNARRFFEYDIPDPVTGVRKPGTAVRPTKQNEYGFTLGGPIRKDKTFFFTNLEYLKLRQIVSSGYVWTMPTAQLKSGDFSPLLDTGTILDHDALGRPIYKGEIFDPSTTRLVGGVPVRDGFGFDPVTGLPITGQANIIPANDPLRSQVAANYLPLVPLPDRAGLSANTFGGSGDPHHILNAATWLVRIDHQFTPSLKMSHTFWTNARPSIRKCGSAGGCDVPSDPFTSPEKNDKYISDGFYQRISNRYAHQQFDWVIKPTVFNHTTIAYDRWYMGGYSISDGVGWLDKLGIKGYPDALDNKGGPPHINYGGGIYGYTGLGTNWTRGFEAVNRWQFADDLTWISGKHTMKAGFEWRWHEMNHSGWARGVAGNYQFNALETGGYTATGGTLPLTGDPLASLILGQVHDSNYFIGLDHTISERYMAPWINDEIKLTPKLTVNLGFRFDYQTPRTERHNRMSTFDPTLPNPGAGNLPGASRFASESNRTFETPKKNSWGPRVAFAYKLTEKDVLRGGYGIYYSGIQYDMWMGSPTTGYETSPVAPNTTNGLYPAYYWDDPFPQARIVRPPNTSASVANNTGPIAVSPEGVTLPRYQNWSLTWERQITPNLLVDVSYVGNHGTRLTANGQAAGYPLDNMNNPAILTYGTLLSRNIKDPGVQATSAVQAMPVDPADGLHKPYAGFNNTLAQALRPFPQYYGIGWRNLQNGNSHYHSLQAKVEKRFTSGLQFRFAYVWSRLIVSGAAESGNSSNAIGCGSDTCSGIQNPTNVVADTSVSNDDIPHTFLVIYTYQLPFGRGKKLGSNANAIVNKFIGGWGLSGIHRYQSGRPLSITMNGGDLTGFLFSGAKRPNKVGGGVWSGGAFDPNKDRYLDKSGWADPGALVFGSAPRVDPDVRFFRYLNEDLSIIKDTYIKGEQYKIRFESSFGNMFNRVFLCNPNVNWSSGAFGQIGAQCNIPRRIQFGLRFDF